MCGAEQPIWTRCLPGITTIWRWRWRPTTLVQPLLTSITASRRTTRPRPMLREHDENTLEVGRVDNFKPGRQQKLRSGGSLAVDIRRPRCFLARLAVVENLLGPR